MSYYVYLLFPCQFRKLYKANAKYIVQERWFIIYYNKSLKEIYKEFSSRKRTNEKNILSSGKKTSPFEILLRQFTDSLVLILIGAFFITLFVGEDIDAYIIGFIILFNALLGFFQEYRAERSVMALKRMMALKARVLRQDKIAEIDSEDIVPGDIIFLSEGDKVPADARIIESKNLLVDESMLTGESLPVEKDNKTIKGKRVLAEQKNMLFSGTIVLKGTAKAIVVAIGKHTQVGNIASEVDADFSMTPLQKELASFGKKLGFVILSICLLIFIVYGIISKNYFSSFLISLSLAVAAVPQALPAVITIALSLGTKRMSKKNALVRRLPAVETLGGVDVICTDKTGTLTLNKMKVEKIVVDHEILSPDEVKNRFIFKIGALCNTNSGDPIDRALSELNKERLKDYHILDEIPFDSERKMMSVYVKEGNNYILYAKGAVDVLLKRCTKIMVHGKVRKMTDDDIRKIEHNHLLLGKKAYKLIGLAFKKGKFTENNLIFAGMAALMDPPREEVKESIRKANEAGIKVVMITGDHALTASAIGAKVGIIGNVISGDEIDDLTDKQLEKKVEHTSIFARVNPSHKLRIVQALKSNGHVVAMTGDGVNDAPALKKADIGISFGSGTDVAKEASEMILLDDNFSTIVKAIEEGRLIYDNILKFISFLLYSNSVEVAVVMFGVLLSLPALPFLYIHLLWINMLTDGLPAISISLDPPEKDIMKRKPKKKHKIIDRRFIQENLLVGITVTISILLLFTRYIPLGIRYAQTVAFTAMVVYEMIILSVVRKRSKLPLFSNIYLWLSVLLTIILQLIILYGIGNIFKTVPITLYDWTVILTIGLILYFGNFFGIKVLDHVKKIKGNKC